MSSHKKAHSGRIEKAISADRTHSITIWIRGKRSITARHWTKISQTNFDCDKHVTEGERHSTLIYSLSAFYTLGQSMFVWALWQWKSIAHGSDYTKSVVH